MLDTAPARRSKVACDARVPDPRPARGRGRDRAVALGGPEAARAARDPRCSRPGASSRPIGSSISLWGEEAPKTATTSLQNAISRLRRELGADVLETRAPGYVLRVAPDQIDARRFERALARCAAAAAPRSGATLLSRRSRSGAVRRSRSSRSTTSRRPRSGRLEELRLVALEERIEADLELGRHGDVVGELEALVARAPAARDVPPAADARALPRGPAGRGARRVPGCARPLRRRARHRARPGAQAAPVGDPASRGRPRRTGAPAPIGRGRRDRQGAPRRPGRSGARPRRRRAISRRTSPAPSTFPTTARSISRASRSTSRR